MPSDVNLDNPFNGDSISINGGGLGYEETLPTSSGIDDIELPQDGEALECATSSGIDDIEWPQDDEALGWVE